MINAFVPMEKGTILIPTGPKNHLHFICCNPVFYPNLNKDCVLLVNISSVDNGLHYDNSCTLNIGDHPFIKHLSYVYYRKSDIYGSDNISRNVAEGNFTVHHPCCDLVFGRILNGFEISDEVTPKIKRFYENFCKSSFSK